MAIDSTLAVRKAGLTRLKNDAAVTAIVPKARWYPQVTPANPEWPFGKSGAPSATPRRAACLDGAEITLAFHGFAKDRVSASRVVETAEDHAARLGAAMAKSLDGHYADIPGGRARFQWTSSQLLMDGAEAGAFHVVVNFRVRCTTV